MVFRVFASRVRSLNNPNLGVRSLNNPPHGAGWGALRNANCRHEAIVDLYRARLMAIGGQAAGRQTGRQAVEQSGRRPSSTILGRSCE